MNKKMEKMATKLVVEVALKSTRLPNQTCFIFLGKPREQMDLAVSDYEKLEDFMKQKH